MIEKLKMQTPNITEQNREQIAKLFPHVMTETKDKQGNTKKAIDFDLLKQALSDVLVDDADERYRLDWPGKKAALLKANTPITKTLRPCREESVNFDTTENLYIEGDNFEVLKILQESYLGKIKMIYIDPPYNTGKDFIYKDNFTAKKADYEEELGTTDEEDNKLFKNTDTNGRFHSDWLSMMYERLLVARDLLKEDGVIFISIDDNEVHNLREICDEVFGEENFVTNIIWQKKSSPSNDAKWISDNHDHIIVFAKDKNIWRPTKLERTEAQNAIYKNSDETDGVDGNGNFYGRGTWFAGDMTVKTISESALYEITTPSGRKVKPAEGRAWVYSKQKFNELCADNRITFGKKGNNKPCIKRFLTEVEESKIVSKSVWLYQEVGENRNGRQEVKVLFDDKGFFDTPKPVSLLSRILQISSSDSNDIILDFFSGSATTAHAVMQLNAEDNGNRKFIMVQLPEATDEKSEAHKAGYKTIAEIGKERIRRAGKKIINDELKKIVNDELSMINEKNNSQSSIHNSPLDTGFRVYKTDSSNMKAVYYHPEQLTQDNLFSLASNIKVDRTPDDLLTQVILDLGLELNLPIEQKQMHGNTVFIVQTNALVACFDDNINIKIIDEIAELKPFKVVFKDAGFAASKDHINLEERFKRLSPETLITVI